MTASCQKMSSLLAKRRARPPRRLNDAEVKRLTKLESLLDALKRRKSVQNRSLATWLTEAEYAQYIDALDNQRELRKELAQKPDDLISYESLLKEAMFVHNRADGYAAKGKSKAAQKLRYEAEARFERALEHLEECIAADPALQMWLDRPVDTAPGGDVSPSSPVTMPRVVTSRSSDNAGGGFRSMFKTIREVKIEAVERAIDALKFE